MRGTNRGGAEVAERSAKKAMVLSLELTRSLRDLRVSAVRSFQSKEVLP
jgi:hypothetical protein